MIDITISLSQSATSMRQALANILAFDNASETHAAVEEAGKLIQQEWLNLASQSFAHPKGEYARGITEGMIYPFGGNPMSVAVINQEPHAKFVEEGTSPYDMKKMLYTSHQVRISKEGKRYMIIPMTHQTPGNDATAPAMPRSVYSIAKNLVATRTVGSYKERSMQTRGLSLKEKVLFGQTNKPQAISAAGAPMAKRSSYLWGGKVMGMGDLGRRTQLNSQLSIPGAVAQPEDYTWKTSPYENMYKMGRSGHTQYVTFRTMSELSSGWISPGMPAMKLAERTANMVTPEVVRMVGDAFIRDVNREFKNLGAVI